MFLLPSQYPQRRLRSLRGLATVCLTLALGGCSWFSGSDNRNDPTPLAQITPTANMAIVWQAPVGSGTTYGFAPAIVGDTVFAASRDGHVAKINATDGSVVWNQKVTKELSSGVGSDGRTVVVVTPEGEVIALDGDGQVKWRAQASSEVSVVPWVDKGVVVVRAGDYRVQAFNAENGERIWTVQRPGPALALRAPARMNEIQGLVLTGMPGGRLLAIEPGSGAVVWEGIVAVPRGASDLERVNDVVGLPIVQGEILCAVAYQGRVSCFNAKEGGRTIWANNISSVVGMAADGRQVYVPDQRSKLVAFTLLDGKPVWTQNALLNRRVTEPATTGRFVVTGDLEGFVHALASDTGAIAARMNVGGNAMLAPVQAVNGGVIVQNGDSSIVRLRLD